MWSSNDPRIKIKKILFKRCEKNMCGYQENSDLVEVKKIKEFVENLGFKSVSNPSSENQIYIKNGTSIAIRKGEK